MLPVLRRNPSLRQRVTEMYRADVALWERVRQHQAPTPKHRSLHEHAADLFRRFPALARAEPSCTNHSTSCDACRHLQAPATTHGTACRGGEACRHLRSRHHCLGCALSHAECGGLGPWELPPKLPRAMGALCAWHSGATHLCNTCDACCSAEWVPVAGPECERCAVRECDARRGAAAPQDAHPRRRLSSTAGAGLAAQPLQRASDGMWRSHAARAPFIERW